MMTRDLQGQLDALVTELGIPQEVSDLITREVSADRGRSAPGLAVGDTAPDFELPDAAGQRVRLSSLLDRGPVIVSFYRGEWCPYCNLALRAWQERLDEVEAAGAQFVAVTPQRPSNALSLADKHALGFSILSDLEQEVIRSYRLRYELSAALKDLYEKVFGVDLSVQNADGSWTLTIPATFVVEQSQRVTYAHADLDWRARAEPTDVLNSLHDISAA